MTDDQFKACFEAHFEGLFVYACTLVKDQGEAKDVVQTSFIKLWEQRSHYREEEAAKAFLYKVVYRLGLNEIRNHKVRSRHHDQLKIPGEEPVRFPAEDKELREKIRAAVDILPERCREVFVKVRLEGMKYREVATEMGISEKTVETQLLRAMKSLRQRLPGTMAILAFLLPHLKNLLK